MPASIRIDGKTILNLISSKQLLIPVYQREYIWKEENVNALLNHIDLRRQDKSDHFMGTISLALGEKTHDGKDTYRIIDGQQRITTVLMIYFAMLKALEQKDPDNEKQYQKEIAKFKS